MGTNIEIASYNVNGLANKTKRLQLFTWLKEKKRTIICLQETHSSPPDEDPWREEWGGSILFSHGLKNSRGVMILFNKGFDLKMEKVEVHPQGRWIIVKLKIEDRSLCLVNIYGPNGDEPSFFVDMNKAVNGTEFESDWHLMVGDYNIVQNYELDRKRSNAMNYHPNALRELRTIMDEKDLVDIWRLKNPKSQRYTWRRQNQASRIDYFLISFSLVAKVKRVMIEDKFRSDHQLISLNLETTEFPRGRGYWKFNQKLLEDQTFVEKTSNFINDFFSYNIGTANPHIVWEAFKCAFRGHTIGMASYRKKCFKTMEQDLKTEIEVLTEVVEKQDTTQDTLDKLEQKQKEFEQLIQERSNISYYKHKAQWMEMGERCNKFFLTLQRRNSSKKNIQKLIMNDGKILITPDEILNEIEKYCTQLYTEDIHEECDENILFPSKHAKLRGPKTIL